MNVQRKISDTPYDSRVDLWLLILFSLSISGATTWLISLEGTYTVKGIVFGITLLIFNIILPLWLLFRCNYRVNTASNTLDIKFGPISWNIPFDSISQVSDSNELNFSPALSIARLKIVYGKNRSILISPKELEKFSQELRAQLKPHLAP